MNHKTIILLVFIILLVGSVSAVPLGQSAGYLSPRPTYNVGESATIADKTLLLVNTGTDEQGNYAIVEVDGVREKIYEMQKVKIGDLEVFVESVSDKEGKKHDFAIIFLAYNSKKRAEGIRRGQNEYEISQGNQVNLRSGEKIIVEKVSKDFVNVKFDGETYKFYLNEEKTIGGYKVLLSRIFYNQKTDSGSIVLKIYPLGEQLKDPKPVKQKLKIPVEKELENINPPEEIKVDTTEPVITQKPDRFIVKLLKRLLYFLEQ